MHILCVMTVFELMAKWPTIEALATDLGRSINTVAAWKRRGKIPAAEWSAVVASAKKRRIEGVTADVLAALHQRPPAIVPP